MILYHGTSDILPIKDFILPPVLTNSLREEFRTTILDYVFLTSSKVSAEKYAKKAVEKFGGSPIIYECETIEEVYKIHNNEFITRKAKIIAW